MNTLSKDTLLDITHEALLRNWDKLQLWAWEEHEREIILREMLAQLDKWLKNNRDTQYLLSAGSLSYFEKWWTGIEVNKAMWMRRYLDGGIRHDDLEDKERKTQNAKHKKREIEEYLADSRKYHNRKKRIQRIAIGIICLLLVTAVAGLIYSLNLQRKISVTSLSNSIATKAYRTLEKDPTLAFRLAEQAYKIAPEPLAKEVLMASYGEMPFYQVLRGHTDLVGNVKFSPNGKFICTGSWDETLRLWEFPSGKEIYELVGHKGMIPHGNPEAINFSPDSKFIVSASNDSTARLWEVSTGKCLAVTKHKRAVSSAVFSPDGTKILTASADKTAKLWDLEGKELVVFKGHTKWVKLAKFSPDGTKILTASGDSTARLWDLWGREIIKIKGENSLYDANFSSSGNKIITGDAGNNVLTWNLNGKNLLSLDGQKDVQFSNYQEYILTRYQTINAKLFDSTGKEVSTIRGHTAKLWQINFSPDGRQILTASDDGTARLWDLSGTELMVLKGHTDQVMSANFSPDGNYVVTASGDKTARIWNIKPKENPVLKGHTALVFDADISNDSKNVVTAGWDYSARLWGKNGEIKNVFNNHKKYAINFSVFVEDGESFLTSAEQTVYWWSIDGNLIKKIEPHDYNYTFNFKTVKNKLLFMCVNNNTITVRDTANKVIQIFKENTKGYFSNDGNYFLSISTDSLLCLWSLNSSKDSIPYKQINSIRLPTTIFSSLEFSPNGQYLLTASEDSVIRLWSFSQIITEKKPHPLIENKINAIISGLKFHPGNKIYAISSDDNIIRLWNLNGKLLTQMIGHAENINEFSFSQQGDFIISGSKDNTARLWDLNGHELQVFTNHKGGVFKSKFFPDGKYILSSSYDHTARIMPVSVEMALDKINKERVRGEVMELSKEELEIFGIIRH